ncbi:MAG: polysaccharide biosynthesis/export family protein [Verrucomicrobia bacterium]|nr:polysaccharide biosynthesis/export family protein [Verrucomicrobiota bacterium]
MNNRQSPVQNEVHPTSGRPWIYLCLLAVLVAAAIGCQSTSRPAVGSPNDLTSGIIASNLMQIREGDVLRINFDNVTNLNTTVSIPIDGTISMQLVGQVKVSGKTVPEVQAELIKLYEPQIRTTEITVNRITSAASYTVGGAVARPGKLPMERPLTVLEAIMEAGGVINAKAKVGEVSVFRIEDGKRSNYKFDLKKALRGQEPSLFYIKPFDVIYVPEKTFNF